MAQMKIEQWRLLSKDYQFSVNVLTLILIIRVRTFMVWLMKRKPISVLLEKMLIKERFLRD